MFVFLRCTDGYVGSRCQFRDPCTTLPCTNGGTCRAVTKGNTVDFSCTCKLGFTDRHCRTPISDACISSPCLNGGTCELESLQTYKCLCPPGWSGNIQHCYGRMGTGGSRQSMNHLFCRPLLCHWVPIARPSSQERPANRMSTSATWARHPARMAACA